MLFTTLLLEVLFLGGGGELRLGFKVRRLQIRMHGGYTMEGDQLQKFRYLERKQGT